MFTVSRENTGSYLEGFSWKRKMKKNTHTHKQSIQSALGKFPDFSSEIFGCLWTSLTVFGHLRQSSEFLWQSAGICVSRRKSSETSTLGRRIITRMWGILCQAHMTAILDRIGIWKCWFLSKRGKPGYPEKNVPLGARERLNKFNKLNPHYVNFQSLSRYARLTSWKIRWRHRIKKNRSSWLDHTRKI